MSSHATIEPIIMGHKPKPIVPENGPSPTLNPQYAKDIQAWLEAMAMFDEMRKKLIALSHHLKHMKNVMYGVIEVMNLFGDTQGAQVKVLSAVDNVDSDMRRAVTEAQGGMNNLAGQGIHPSNGMEPILNPKDTPMKPVVDSADANKLIQFVKALQALLDTVKQKYPHLMDKGSIANFEEALKNIKGAFGSDWGNATKMAGDVESWANPKDGVPNPKLKNLTDALQTLNQSTSALATTTSTSLQFVSEKIKQILGIQESSIQSYQKFIQNMVQGLRG